MNDQALLANEAISIQQRRGWSRAYCCQLSGLRPSTWTDHVMRARWKRLRWGIRKRLAAFVETYRDDSVMPPPRAARWKRGDEHHLSKLTAEQRAMVIASPKKGVELARELNVSSSLITRTRQAG